MTRKRYRQNTPVPFLFYACFFFFLPVFAFAQAGPEEKGEQIFNARCISCHTIGGGKKVGPDLQGVTTRRPKNWLIAFIANPDKLFAANDPYAAKLLSEYKVRMPNLKLSPDDVNALMAFLESKQEAAEHAERPITGPPAGKPSAPPAPGNFQTGSVLFSGGERFIRGGPPCISCHNVSGIRFIGGGNLGPDLTTSYSRFGEGLAPVLTTITFPTMRPVFANSPLTPQEVGDLVAYFQQTAARPPRTYTARYIVVSAVAFVVLVLIGALIWRNRLSGVRKGLVGRAEQEAARR